MPKRFHRLRLSPTAVLLLGFLAIIVLGGLLLMLPLSSQSRTFTSPLTAFFTATSATCVTGLSVVNTACHWSLFGKVVILLLIQIGGLGFMSLAMLFSLLLRRRVSPRERLIFMQSMNLPAADGLRRFLRRMFVTVLAAEAGGALVLTALFCRQFGFAKALGYGIFHAVSAFCNAGFDLFGDSLNGFASDGAVLGTVAVLIVFGGLGFAVWDELAQAIRHKAKLSLYARMVLVTSACLVVLGTLGYLATEWDNPATVGEMSPFDKLQNCLFQSVSMRTAGFSSFDHGGMRPLSLLCSMFLMFIGGSSGSTAGGVKTVTFALLLIAALQIFKGRNEVRFRRRRIPQDAVSRAFALVFFGGVCVFVSILLLSFTERIPLGSLAYEVFSAFGTVGVSTGVTASFSAFGQLWLMLLMFAGRLGVASVAYTVLLSLETQDGVIRYPKADLLIG